MISSWVYNSFSFKVWNSKILYTSTWWNGGYVIRGKFKLPHAYSKRKLHKIFVLIFVDFKNMWRLLNFCFKLVPGHYFSAPGLYSSASALLDNIRCSSSQRLGTQTSYETRCFIFFLFKQYFHQRWYLFDGFLLLFWSQSLLWWFWRDRGWSPLVFKVFFNDHMVWLEVYTLIFITFTREEIHYILDISYWWKTLV